MRENAKDRHAFTRQARRAPPRSQAAGAPCNAYSAQKSAGRPPARTRASPPSAPRVGHAPHHHASESGRRMGRACIWHEVSAEHRAAHGATCTESVTDPSLVMTKRVEPGGRASAKVPHGREEETLNIETLPPRAGHRLAHVTEQHQWRPDLLHETGEVGVGSGLAALGCRCSGC